VLADVSFFFFFSLRDVPSARHPAAAPSDRQ
jgi:hypothetical protein